MENQLRNLFRETGDPRMYLLYKAGRVGEKRKKKKRPKRTGAPPPASL